MSTTKYPKTKVGRTVRIPFGNRTVEGEITEDRGPIGGKGKRLYAVQIPMDPFEPMTVEVPEDEIEFVDQTQPELDRSKLISFLNNGGLVSILQRGTGGPSQPVWLTLDHLGNVTYTFIEKRAGTLNGEPVGGKTIPFWAIEGEDKIFEPKQDRVVEFLRSFGLTDQEAKSVVAAVGTASHSNTGS